MLLVICQFTCSHPHIYSSLLLTEAQCSPLPPLNSPWHYFCLQPTEATTAKKPSSKKVDLFGDDGEEEDDGDLFADKPPTKQAPAQAPPKKKVCCHSMYTSMSTVAYYLWKNTFLSGIK